MNKKIISLLLILSITVSLFGCTGKKPSPEPSPTPVVELDVTERTTNNANYYFTGLTESEINSLTLFSEAIWSKFGNRTNNKSITYTRGETKQSISISDNRLNYVLNHDDITSLGALVFFYYETLLPAWFCMGLELLWAEEANVERYPINKEIDVKAWCEAAEKKGLPSFGDEWLIPGLVDSELKEDFPSVAYKFVKWLDEKGELMPLIKKFKDDTTFFEVESLFRKYWTEFSGTGVVDNDIIYRYMYNIQSDADTDGNAYAEFAILSNQTSYVFDIMYWDDKKRTLDMYSDSFDNAIRYVCDFFGYDLNERLNVYITKKSQSEGLAAGTGRGNNIILYSFYYYTYMPILAHEAAHCISYFITGKHQSDFIFLAEGLAEAVENKYYKDKYSFDTNAHLKAVTAIKYFDEYDKYGDYSVNRMVNDTVNEYTIASTTTKPSELPYGYLNSYQTSCSFVLFLLEKGSLEDFMKFYLDTSVAEVVYGKDFDGLYKEWFSYLGLER